MDEKKVIFSGVDNVSQKAKQIYDGILASARKQSDSLKEQTSYINQQITALQKKNDLEAKSALKQSDVLFKEARKAAPGKEREEAFERARSTRTSVVGAGKEAEKVVELLQELLNETKKEATSAAKAEAEQIKNRKRTEDLKMREEARGEVRTDKAGIRKKIKEVEQSVYEGLSEEEIRKVKYQKSLVGREGGEDKKGVFMGTFLGNLAASLVSKIAGKLSTISTAESGDQALTAILSGIPGIGGIFEKTRQEQYAVQSKELELSARTGRGIRGTGATNVGFSTRESLELTGGLIGAAGNAQGAGQTGSARLLQRALGLSTQELTQIVKDTRTARSGAEMVEVVNQVVAANPELKRDRTKLSEVLGQSSQLLNNLAQGTEDVNQKAVTGIVGALRSVGGSFSGDPAIAAARMNAINQSLTSPGTEYQKARNFGVLSGLRPGASYTELLEMQEKGLGQKGFLGGIVKQISKEGGQGENAILSLSQNLNIPVGTARKMLQAYRKDPSVFDNFAGTTGELDKMFKEQGGMARAAEKLTAGRDVQKATLDNEFLHSEFAGLGEVIKQTADVSAKAFTNAANAFFNNFKNNPPAPQAIPQ